MSGRRRPRRLTLVELAQALAIDVSRELHRLHAGDRKAWEQRVDRLEEALNVHADRIRALVVRPLDELSAAGRAATWRGWKHPLAGKPCRTSGPFGYRAPFFFPALKRPQRREGLLAGVTEQ